MKINCGEGDLVALVREWRSPRFETRKNICVSYVYIYNANWANEARAHLSEVLKKLEFVRDESDKFKDRMEKKFFKNKVDPAIEQFLQGASQLSFLALHNQIHYKTANCSGSHFHKHIYIYVYIHICMYIYIYIYIYI